MSDVKTPEPTPPKSEIRNPKSTSAAPAPQPGKVRPLIVQAIAKQMQKLLMQRNLLTSPSESAALEPGTAEAKQAGKK